MSDLFEGMPYVYKRRSALPAVRYRCITHDTVYSTPNTCPDCVKYVSDLHAKWARLRNLICGGGPGVRKHRAELMRVNHAIMAMQTTTEEK